MGQSRIRPIAICLFRKGHAILVDQHRDSVKGDKFCRPLGGGIEYGETSEEAMIREIREETGESIADLELLCVLENIFTGEGALGHEIVFVYDARFRNDLIQESQTIQGCEGDEHFTAEWKTLDQMREENLRLVPEGLVALLVKEGQG
ncbi:MAG: NUDIX domain-containing protein [Spirochaetia bacterium]|nr:NUDIX domain-containing protein [Spirochaetia bacterium]